jgi:RNA methyltransferase, TrmH family
MASITSAQNPLIKLLRSLDLKKTRKETGLFCAAGVKVLTRARSLGWTPEHLLYCDEERPVALAHWGKPQSVSARLMESLSGQANPPAALASFKQRWAGLPSPDGAGGGLWLALEGIRDPGNLGTMIRTAEAAGAAGVILVGDCCDPWSQDCVRATMGSIFAVPLAKAAVPDFLKLAQSWPGEVVGTEMQSETDFRRAYREPVLAVMGSEGDGLSAPVAGACASLVRIPMASGPESLNVAIATALMLYEIKRPALK